MDSAWWVQLALYIWAVRYSDTVFTALLKKSLVPVSELRYLFL